MNNFERALHQSTMINKAYLGIPFETDLKPNYETVKKGGKGKDRFIEVTKHYKQPNGAWIKTYDKKRINYHGINLDITAV